MTQFNNHPVRSHGNEIDLGQQVRNLMQHKYKILLAMLVGGALGAAYSFSATPLYRAEAMLEIETKQNQVLTEINNILSNDPTDLTSEGQVDLVQSRAVIGKTVDDLQLDREITPQYLPLIGRLIHKINGGIDPVLKTGIFTVREDWINEPFMLTAKNSKSYTLTLPDGRSLPGTVGTPLKIDASTTLQVTQILAEPNQEFELVKFSKLSAIENVKKSLAVVSKGKTSPIINLSYTSEDPKHTSTVLNRIADNYVNQNRERDVQVATSGLAFISEELPRLKTILGEAEDRLNAYRKHSGSLDIPVESKGAIESLTSIESQITALKTEEAGLAELYTPEHPNYKAVLDKLSVLENAKNRINQQIASLPNTQQEVIRLNRDVETSQATYTQLLAKQQELNILKASAQGNVRVIDHAFEPEKPVAPRKAVITLLSALGLGTLAAAWYMTRKTAAVRQGLLSTDEIESSGLEISAQIPYSKTQRKHDARDSKFKIGGGEPYLLATDDGADAAVEAIRGLRTNIYFSMIDAKNNVLMITGATPSAGKSFISSNLATVMAQSGKTVLLIDTDMRRGYLEQSFGVRAENGLAELLGGKISPKDAVQTTEIPNLSFISHGEYPKNPSELLMDNRFRELLEQAKGRYDYIIIDTPPVLAVTDAAIIGQHAGTSLMVVRYDSTTADEMHESINRLRHNKVQIKGIVFNGIKREAPNSGYHYYAYTTAYGDKPYPPKQKA
ncbi:polysaccharide biosynthesis tyrosine autokinase [Neisseria sp.]|uniref:polysaccharide biosynthesis tyrosine autokinase n=1 Tax=Neisseria sp. TaxID=192066 RepID=UPI0035A0643B